VRGTRVERNRASGGRIERNRSQDRSQAPSSVQNQSRNESSYRSESRSRSPRNSSSRDRYRSNDRNRSNDRYRNNDRYSSRNYGRYGRSSRYGNRSPFHYSGRIRSVYPYGGGYRVWLTGCQYPFFIPSAYYHRDRFRIGLTIALGGYYNSRGYYDYYDDYYNDRYYDEVSISRGEIRGVVEIVDYRRETFVVRNDATGSFVTVYMRDRGRDPVRAGDVVSLGGDWTRSGAFEAYRVDILETTRRYDD
jgi:hypothetical protein